MNRWDFLLIAAFLLVASIDAAPSASPPKYAANSTITPKAGTSGGFRTGAQPSASMCEVTRNGLAPIGDGPPNPAVYSTACSCNAIVSKHVGTVQTVVTGMNSDGSLWSETQPVKAVTDAGFIPPKDCCVECLITAKDVQILYWPVETAGAANNLTTAANFSTTAAPTPYSLVSNGQTFISPTVYVAYRSLGPAENCPAFGPGYFAQNGSAFDTTIGYPPEALSTSMCNGPPAGFQLYTAINYTELQYPTGAQTQGTCEWRINESGTPRGPYLSIPNDIKNVKPEWASCSGAFEGTFDPPKALKKASDMVAPTPAPDTVPDNGAKPGPTIAPANPPPTPAPAPNPGSGDQQPEPNKPDPDPANSDPGNGGSGKSDPSNGADSPAAADPNKGNSNPNNGNTNNDNPSNGNSDPGDNNGHGDPGNGNPGTGNANSGGSNQGSPQGNNPNPHSSNGPSHGQGSNSPASNNGGSSNGNPSNSNPGIPVSGQSSGQNGNSGQEFPQDSQNSNPSNPQAFGGGNGGDPGAAPAANPAAPNSVVANGNTIVRNLYGGVVVAGSTYMPGSTAQLSGAPLSVAPDHVVVGGSSYALPAPPPGSPVLFSGQSIAKAQGGGIVIGGATIGAGSQTAVAGHTVSVDSSNAIVDGSTYALPPSPGGAILAPAPTPAPVLVGGQSVTRAANGGVVIGGSTIAAGASATIAGQVISVGDSAAVIGGTSYALPTNAGAVVQQGPSIAQNIAAHSALALANGAVITAGGAPATVDGTVIAIPSADNGIVVNGKTVPLTALPIPIAAGPSVYTVAGQTFTAAPTGFAIGSQSLTPGGSAITLSGTVISLGPSGLQIGTSTVPLSSPLPSVFTVGGQVFTAAPDKFAIGSQTLTSGGAAITLAGTVLSLGPSGLEIGTSTIPLTPAEQSADAGGLGSLIMGGLGANPTGSAGGASNGSDVVPFTGEGSRLGIDVFVTIAMGLCCTLVMVML
ncbi:hypothetical protein ACLMJK_002012 [Lecanora helva]